jgi:hypothetical protein
MNERKLDHSQSILFHENNLGRSGEPFSEFILQNADLITKIDVHGLWSIRFNSAMQDDCLFTVP